MVLRPLIKRFLFYVFLCLITWGGLLFFVISGGREQGNTYYIVCVLLIPQYIFGAFFLKTKLIYKFIIPLITTFFSECILRLIAQTSFFDMTNSKLLFFVALFLPIVFVWEITYQILKKVKINTKKMKKICPICGYDKLEDYPSDNYGYPTYGICSCCGYEFGFDDSSRKMTFEAYRDIWAKNGYKFVNKKKKPKEWNKDLAEAQIKNVAKTNYTPRIC